MEEIIQETLSKGVEMHISGEFDLADQLYASVIKLQPHHADANHNMGLLKADMGQDLEALPYLQIALQADTSIAQFWLSYIRALIKLDRVDEAARILNLATESGVQGEEFLELHQKLNELTSLVEAVKSQTASLNQPNPNPGSQSPSQGAINHLLNLYNQGQLSAAVEQARALVEQYPSAFIVWNILGAANKGLGQVDEAAEAFQKVTELNPNYADGFNNLGVTLKEQGRLNVAIEAYNKAITLKPGYAEAYFGMGNALQDKGNLEEAIEAYKKAHSLRPDYAESYYNMGNALHDQGKLKEAIEAYKKALSITPDYAKAYNNMGNALKEQGQLKGAIKSYQNALTLKPDYAEAYYNMGNALKDQGALEEAIEAYKKTLSMKPDYAEAFSNFIFCLDSTIFENAELYNEIASAFDEYSSAKVGKKFQNKSYSGSRKIRLGFVSGDLRDHPVGYFSESLFKYIDQANFELVVYNNSTKISKQTNLLRQFTKEWRIIKGVPDNEVAEIIHNDKIDILIDLSGHTALNRLPVFAYRPCAIQATWLGYFGSTCLSEMDYILGDRFVLPVGTENHFSEKFALLPQTYICFSAPDFDIPVGPTPAKANKFITFGCFNNVRKINENVIKIWSEILMKTAKSKMIFKGTGYTGDEKETIIRHFRNFQIDPNRIAFERESPRRILLESYHNVDIGLDPFPYTGGTTTCEALWMGVPTVTKKGTTFLTNIGQTIAINSGYQHLCTDSSDEYIDIAVGLTKDVEKLNRDRLERRALVLKSPLFDGEHFAAEFENLMQKMIRDFQKDEKC